MLFIYGNTTGPPKGHKPRGLSEEYARADGPCDWVHENWVGGLGWGVEGIVRMNAGFELIWCNFSSPSLRLMSHLNVSAPLLPDPDEAEGMLRAYEESSQSYFPLPTATSRPDKSSDPAIASMPGYWPRDQEPFLPASAWDWFGSATGHYGASGMGPGSGETLVNLLSCGLMNFYAPPFRSQESARAREEQQALNLTAVGLWLGPAKGGNRTTALKDLTRRWRNHSLSALTKSDALLMNKAAERVLRGLGFGNSTSSEQRAQCTGADWAALTNGIVQRHANRLEVLHSILSNYPNIRSKNHTALRKWFTTVRYSTHTFLLRFLQYPASAHNNSTPDETWNISSSLGRVTYSRCRYQHTRLLAPDERIILSPEEATLHWAVEETLGGICSVLADVGFAVEREWFKGFNILDHMNSNSALSKEIDDEVAKWTQGVEELMAWLG